MPKKSHIKSSPKKKHTKTKNLNYIQKFRLYFKENQLAIPLTAMSALAFIITGLGLILQSSQSIFNASALSNSQTEVKVVCKGSDQELSGIGFEIYGNTYLAGNAPSVVSDLPSDGELIAVVGSSPGSDVEVSRGGTTKIQINHESCSGDDNDSGPDQVYSGNTKSTVIKVVCENDPSRSLGRKYVVYKEDGSFGHDGGDDLTPSGNIDYPSEGKTIVEVRKSDDSGKAWAELTEGETVVRVVDSECPAPTPEQPASGNNASTRVLAKCSESGKEVGANFKTYVHSGNTGNWQPISGNTGDGNNHEFPTGNGIQINAFIDEPWHDPNNGQKPLTSGETVLIAPSHPECQSDPQPEPSNNGCPNPGEETYRDNFTWPGEVKCVCNQSYEVVDMSYCEGGQQPEPEPEPQQPSLRTERTTVTARCSPGGKKITEGVPYKLYKLQGNAGNYNFEANSGVTEKSIEFPVGDGLKINAYININEYTDKGQVTLVPGESSLIFPQHAQCNQADPNPEPDPNPQEPQQPGPSETQTALTTIKTKCAATGNIVDGISFGTYKYSGNISNWNAVFDRTAKDIEFPVGEGVQINAFIDEPGYDKSIGQQALKPGETIIEYFGNCQSDNPSVPSTGTGGGNDGTLSGPGGPSDSGAEEMTPTKIIATCTNSAKRLNGREFVVYDIEGLTPGSSGTTPSNIIQYPSSRGNQMRAVVYEDYNGQRTETHVELSLGETIVPVNSHECDGQNAPPNPTQPPSGGSGDSKLSVYMLGSYSENTRRLVNSGKLRTIKAMDPQAIPEIQNAVNKFKELNPEGVSVLRVYIDWSTPGEDPEAYADSLFDDKIKPKLDEIGSNNLSKYDYLETPNEFDNTKIFGSQAEVEWNDKFWKRIVEKINGYPGNLRPCTYSFGVTQPGDNLDQKMEWLLPSLRATRDAGGAICYHSYTLNYSTDQKENNTSLKYRQIHDRMCELDSSLCNVPFLLTEAGVDYTAGPHHGWRDRERTNISPDPSDAPDNQANDGNVDDFISWLSWFDDRMMEDDYVIGAHLFQSGEFGEEWRSFNVDDDGVTNFILESLGADPNQQVEQSAAQEQEDISIGIDENYGGAVTSLIYNGKEYVNNEDHGRQIQTTVALEGYGECLMPTEAGNDEDQGASTTRFLGSQTSGNITTTSANPAYWLKAGKAKGNSACGRGATGAVNTTDISDLLLEKRITEGVFGLPNVVEYKVNWTPDQTYDVFDLEAVTAYLKKDFNKISTYNPANNQESQMNPGHSGENTQDPLIFSTEDGNYALGIINKEMKLGSLANGKYVVYDFTDLRHDPSIGQTEDLAATKMQTVFHSLTDFDGKVSSTSYLVVGNKQKVKDTMSAIWDSITEADNANELQVTVNDGSTASASGFGDLLSFNSNNDLLLTGDTSQAKQRVAKVEFYKGDELLGEDTTKPFKYTWKDVQAGNYKLKAVGYDASGNVLDNSDVRLIVQTIAGDPNQGNIWSTVGAVILSVGIFGFCGFIILIGPEERNRVIRNFKRKLSRNKIS
jgi:hypothetical protein